MLCKICGAQIPDNSTECEFCGAKTGVGAETEQVSEDTQIVNSEVINDIVETSLVGEDIGTEEIFDDNEKRRRKQMEKMLEDKKKQLSEIERRRNEKRLRQRRNRIMVIALICALAVAAAGIGAYYVAQNIDGRPGTTEAPAPTAGLTTALPAVTPSVTANPEPLVTVEPYREAEVSSDGASWSATSNSNTNNSSSGRPSSGSSGSGSSAGSSSSGASSSNKGNSSGASSGSVSASGTGGGGQTSQNVANSGIASNNISSQLSTGGEVIYNSGTGKYLMTFVSGGTRYYANVSAGSTTEQIKNKRFTITANPTAVTYNGNTVYEITSMTGYDGSDYLLPESGIRLLTDSDIKGMSKYDLALARNEIYARHGRKFQTAEYSDYFTSKSWYKINPNYNYSDDNSNLNSIESKNVQFILNAEKNK